MSSLKLNALSIFWIGKNEIRTAYLTIKRRCRNHITASFSKMVSPSDLILSDHVTISLLPFKIWLSSSSTSSFSTKATNDALVETSPQAVLRFSVYLLCFCPFAFFLFDSIWLYYCVNGEVVLKELKLQKRLILTKATWKAVHHFLMEKVV